jgi:TolB protein
VPVRWKLAILAGLGALLFVSSVAYAESSYVVQPGDYLFAIGLKFGVHWQGIAAENKIPPPYTIYPGQVLKIPESACGEGDHSCYTVQPGDYLYLIGQRLGVPWHKIAETNHLSPPYTIYPGEQLVIPPG